MRRRKSNMKRMPRAVKILLLLTILGLLVLAVWECASVWWANRTLHSTAWYESANPEEKLRVAHRVISFPIGNHHDAFLLIKEHGDWESVPRLISALKWQQKDPATMPCTTSHCLEALEKLTGASPGPNCEDWVRWWKTEGKQQAEQRKQPD